MTRDAELLEALQLLEALRELWEARCSRYNYAARGSAEASAAPYASFGATAAKEALYALCEEVWGTEYHREPLAPCDPYEDS